MLKSRNYYAIKFGNGVQNIIVESKEELKKYVNPKYSVYKEFKRYKYAKEYLESSSDMENKIIEICKQIYFKEEATKKIQQKFDFLIPGYIMDSIIKCEKCENIKSLILLAIANRGITVENAHKLIEYLMQGEYANES